MIQLALRMYHVPEVIQVMLDDYFSGFRMRFSTNNYTTNWVNLEVGIAMGCTISPILSTVFTTEGEVKKWRGGSIPINTHRKGLLDGCDDWVVSADLPGWERHPDVIRKTANAYGLPKA
ncbi:reverse transcriptase [Plakobranchus ocellatus]|uniref:Reverse transcriptase n=1 Tax=Plakobranchus ocellatus TaxID=259542 RepID=A0AAV4ATY8_9GAST|nr:reverse transcriptase [Plakobranchus ocellatus]